MYLSKIVLNLRNPNARRDMTSAYEMHRTLMNILEEGDNRLLWRLEQRRLHTSPYVLVQTLKRPDLQKIFTKNGHDYGMPMPDSPKEFCPIFKKDDAFYFRLVANPSKMKNRKRLGLYKQEEQESWLLRKMTVAGADVESFAIRDSFKIVTGPLKGKGDRKITMLAVTFEGLLRVWAPHAFLRAIKYGVGHGKAFGLGLLSIAGV